MIDSDSNDIEKGWKEVRPAHPCGVDRALKTLITWILLNDCGEILVDAGRIAGIVTVVILAICMLVFPIAALETDIPTADYELTIGEETTESESIEITNSTYSPVSSVLVTNQSVLSPLSFWNAIHIPGSDLSYFEKIVSVPYLNVSDLILTVSAHIIDGPLEISMEENSIIGQTGENC